MDNFDPYSVLLAIATNMHVLLLCSTVTYLTSNISYFIIFVYFGTKALQHVFMGLFPQPQMKRSVKCTAVFC